MSVLKSMSIFVLAGICEIGGGYLVWLWLKKGYGIGFGIAGAMILVLYGIVVTWQDSNFGRVYAAYGGIFIVMSLIWAYAVDDFKPDKYDIIGAIAALLGVCIIYFAPRS